MTSLSLKDLRRVVAFPVHLFTCWDRVELEGFKQRDNLSDLHFTRNTSVAI